MFLNPLGRTLHPRRGGIVGRPVGGVELRQGAVGCVLGADHFVAFRFDLDQRGHETRIADLAGQVAAFATDRLERIIEALQNHLHGILIGKRRDGLESLAPHYPRRVTLIHGTDLGRRQMTRFGAMLERCGPLHSFQRRSISVHGREAIGRVPDQVRLEPAEFFLPGTQSLTEREQTQQLVSPFVLQHVDGITLGGNAVAGAEDMVAGHIPRLVEGAVVAGVQDHEPGIGVNILEIFERDVHIGLGNRVALGFGG